MKTIDKTNSTLEWTYGTVLKCWNNDPKEFNLYRVANGCCVGGKFKLDILNDSRGVEDGFWQPVSDNIEDIKHDLRACFMHIVPVKATIIIEDLVM